MIPMLTLFIIIWFLMFSATRFLQYYRIVKEYKGQTVARVAKVSSHEKKKKKEKPAVDVLLTYMIDGKEGQSEVIVPAEMADKYPVGKELEICYKISPNGAVHIASYSSANKKIMYGHLAAIGVELGAFILIWVSML